MNKMTQDELERYPPRKMLRYLNMEGFKERKKQIKSRESYESSYRYRYSIINKEVIYEIKRSLIILKYY